MTGCRVVCFSAVAIRGLVGAVARAEEEQDEDEGEGEKRDRTVCVEGR